MATIKHFEDIEAWKLARELCGDIGVIIDNGSFKRSFRLIHQIEGSCGEFRSQLYRALDREYLTKETFDNFYIKAVRISAMLQKLIDYLLKTEVKGQG